MLKRVQEAVREIGVPRVTAAGIVAKLRSAAGGNHVPSKSTIRLILLRKFGMSYRAANAAKTKYNDTDFDEKRVWVSRLLA